MTNSCRNCKWYCYRFCWCALLKKHTDRICVKYKPFVR